MIDTEETQKVLVNAADDIFDISKKLQTTQDCKDVPMQLQGIAHALRLLRTKLIAAENSKPSKPTKE